MKCRPHFEALRGSSRTFQCALAPAALPPLSCSGGKRVFVFVQQPRKLSLQGPPEGPSAFAETRIHVLFIPIPCSFRAGARGDASNLTRRPRTDGKSAAAPGEPACPSSSFRLMLTALQHGHLYTCFTEEGTEVPGGQGAGLNLHLLRACG